MQRLKDSSSKSTESVAQQQTIFSEVLNSSLPESEKQNARIGDEAMILVIAGTESTSKTLSRAVYSVLDDSKVLSELQKELDAASPDPSQEMPLAKAEALPYLVSLKLSDLLENEADYYQTAVLKEALRVQIIQTSPSLLTADEPIRYGSWTLPPGVSCTHPLITHSI